MTNAELATGMVLFRDWLETKDISTDGSRLETIIDFTSALSDTATASEYVQTLAPRERDLAVECYFDAFSFVMMYRTLSRLRSDQIPRSSLRKAIQGPVDPSDEVPGSDNVTPRSHMFELELACRYIEAGLNVVGYDDILIDINGVRVSIQCKRIHSQESFASSFRKAVLQIQKRIPAVAAYGVVCISVDRVAGTTNRIVLVPPGRDLVSMARRLLRPFQPLLMSSLRDTLDIRILGGMVDLKCFGAGMDSGRHMLARQSACARLDASIDLLAPERGLFDMLVER